ncbi:MAG TPA: hypothetical protein VHL58_05670, partial [Thermoanaerobaculia bacterium]|nr:hypothetical protein [Thermoanaerobaculia bacterium]
MDSLPTPEERKWLGRYLRKLIERRGIDAFVAAPILEPTSKTFPDRWSGQLADVHRLTQRLMDAAGLAQLEILLTGVDAGTQSRELWDAGTAGWFAGIVDGRCNFGVHPSQLRDPEQAIGVMAHEVAHAYRTHYHLRADDRGRE